MHEITHYHSLDEVLGAAPPIDALCPRCISLNFMKLFSGLRYEDFDQGYEDPRLDVFVATLAEIRRSTDQCRICFIIIAFHEAIHRGERGCTNGLGENLEHCILKPYRADALLHMKDQSGKSNKEALATSLNLAFISTARKKSDGIYWLDGLTKNWIGKGLFAWVKDALLQSSTLFQRYLLSESMNNEMAKDAIFEGLAPESVAQSSDNDLEGEHASGSESDAYEENSAPLELPGSAYSVHNCFFSLTASSCVENRLALSSSDSLLGSAIDWCSLKGWLKACETDHPGCRRDHGSLPPEDGMRIRCIDVKTSQIVCLDFQSRYLALSYVWGAPRSEIAGYVVRSVIKDNSIIITQNLPPTVRDAIEVTKRLGERYLWVDCVCIDQNDLAVVEEQIDLMDRIYENALLTIITATGDSVHDNIPGLRRNTRLKSSIEILIDGRLVKGVCARSVVGEFFGPWQKRGWTFQEWLLSRRSLFFSTDQILFRCQESSGLESFVPPRSAPSSDKDQIPHFWADTRSATITLSRLPLGAPAWSFQTYAELIRDYTCRNLTYDSDVLHAFTGIMRKLERSCGMSFIEGLPETDLLRALLWSSMNELNQGTQKFRRPERPSWTWCAFGCQSGYLCWEVDESTGPTTALAQRYRTIIGSPTPKSRSARADPLHSKRGPPKSVLLSIGWDFSKVELPDLYKAFRYRRATAVLYPGAKESKAKRLMMTSETRRLLVHQNPPDPNGRGIVCFRPSRDDVLHPVTKKVIDGRHLVDAEWPRFVLFYVNVGPGGEERFSFHDAILLYEWDISNQDENWHQRVVAMIIDRLSDGTVERVSLTSICSEDWYSLPLVSEREDLVMV
jgi:hypothetical protein